MKPRVGVAFSGGGDSVYLLLKAIAEQEQPPVALHVCHNVREEGSQDREEAFVQQFCRAKGIELRVEELPPLGATSEAEMRRARYAALARMAKDLDRVLLGHHADDQVETMLLNLFRGSDLEGFKGMQAEIDRHGVRFERPLLTTFKTDMVNSLRSKGESWFNDPSNAETRYKRNFLRQDILPPLDTAFPGWRERMLGLGRSIHNTLDWMEELTPSGWEEDEEGVWIHDRKVLQSCPSPLLQRWSRSSLERFCPGARDITRHHVESFASFSASEQLGPHSLNFPGGVRLRGRKRNVVLLLFDVKKSARE